MSDVLFDSGKYSLKPGAREKLAKVAGILLAYPGLNIEVGGYTDNVGGDAMNQTLSENRAGSVRDYLVQQGVSTNSVSARGFGNTLPVSSNNNSAGRQQNRRVELLVSGEAIGKPGQHDHRKLALTNRVNSGEGASPVQGCTLYAQRRKHALNNIVLIRDSGATGSPATMAAYARLGLLRNRRWRAGRFRALSFCRFSAGVEACKRIQHRQVPPGVGDCFVPVRLHFFSLY